MPTLQTLLTPKKQKKEKKIIPLKYFKPLSTEIQNAQLYSAVIE